MANKDTENRKDQIKESNKQPPPRPVFGFSLFEGSIPWPIKALKVFAHTSLIVGLGYGVVFWRDLGIVAGGVFMVKGIFLFTLLLVVAGMAENLIAIRQNTEALLESYLAYDD